MVTLTSVTPHSYSSSTLTPRCHSSPFSSYSRTANERSSCYLTIRSVGSSNQLLSSPSISSGMRIRSAATKPAKSPAEEDWKIKRERLLEKRVELSLSLSLSLSLFTMIRWLKTLCCVRSVDVKEALRLQKENNFVILDVRPEAEFKEAHPPGAINVQIYRLIKEWTAWDIARRAAFAFFGIFSGTEENPEFMQSVESKIDKNSKIIVACSSGGTMKPSQNLPEGQQSRIFLPKRSLGVVLKGGACTTWKMSALDMLITYKVMGATDKSGYGINV
ncbi:hypothetical protein F0562_030999 [Nyssa sinensis]|uniref:Rhodanese domain-containing protein n=1 Tax=Nyssa sinensis TaxID=561372 RepID=A0A5J5AUL5_9ASTE|nr:hypothetical protein F0562_030999 [Nyssa sinensis]